MPLRRTRWAWLFNTTWVLRTNVKIAVAIESVDPPPKLVTFDLNLPALSVQAVLATCQARGIAST